MLIAPVESHGRLLQGKDWAAAVEALKHGKSYKMQINKTNKGGVKGQVEGLTGIEVFVPFSKLSTGSYGSKNPQSKEMKSLIGTTINVKVVAVRSISVELTNFAHFVGLSHLMSEAPCQHVTSLLLLVHRFNDMVIDSHSTLVIWLVTGGC